ncbi:hypothetical protein WDU94_001733 [Cyamophila willieti]
MVDERTVHLTSGSLPPVQKTARFSSNLTDCACRGNNKTSQNIFGYRTTASFPAEVRTILSNSDSIGSARLCLLEAQISIFYDTRILRLVKLGVSAHAKEVDVAVNAAVRLVSGCLKPSPVEKIYPIVGLAPPRVRRKVISEIERTKQSEDERHPLHGHIPHRSRLKSRKSFLRSTEPLIMSPQERKEELWKHTCSFDIPGKEEISPGFHLPYSTWKTINRLRVGVSRCKKTLSKWGYTETQDDILCDCGEVQDEAHLLVCTNIGTACTRDDLERCTPAAIKVAEFWRNVI